MPCGSRRLRANVTLIFSRDTHTHTHTGHIFQLCHFVIADERHANARYIRVLYWFLFSHFVPVCAAAFIAEVVTGGFGTQYPFIIAPLESPLGKQLFFVCVCCCGCVLFVALICRPCEQPLCVRGVLRTKSKLHQHSHERRSLNIHHLLSIQLD